MPRGGRRRARSALREELFRDRFARRAGVPGDLGEDGGQGAHAQRVVVRDGEVVLATRVRGEAEGTPVCRVTS